MFLESGVTSYGFGSVLLAVRYATLTASYVPDNELEVKRGWLMTSPRYQAKIFHTERLLFSLKRKGTTKK
jgi:hypothetical protein